MREIVERVIARVEKFGDCYFFSANSLNLFISLCHGGRHFVVNVRHSLLELKNYSKFYRKIQKSQDYQLFYSKTIFRRLSDNYKKTLRQLIEGF